MAKVSMRERERDQNRNPRGQRREERRERKRERGVARKKTHVTFLVVLLCTSVPLAPKRVRAPASEVRDSIPLFIPSKNYHPPPPLPSAWCLPQLSGEPGRAGML